jgi:hypothetical protein
MESLFKNLGLRRGHYRRCRPQSLGRNKWHRVAFLTGGGVIMNYGFNSEYFESAYPL